MQAEIYEVAKAIKQQIVELDSYKDLLEKLAIDASNAEAEYEKKIGIEMAELKNGREKVIGNEVIKNPAQSTLSKYARSICWKEKLNMDIANYRYRNAHKMCDIIQTILNGYQSIFRRLD